MRASGLIFALGLLTATSAGAQQNSAATTALVEQCEGKGGVAAAASEAACSSLLAGTYPTINRAQAQYRRGEVRFDQQNYAGAKADIDAVLATADISTGLKTDAYVMLGRIAAATRDIPASRAALDNAVATKPGVGAYYWRAALAIDDKRPRDAVADLDRALAPEMRGTADQRALLLRLRAIAYDRLEQTDRALADYDAALGEKPDYAQAIYDRAELLDSLGRLAEARDGYDRVVLIEPTYPNALNSSCWIRAAKLKTDFAKARAYCADAVTRQPEEWGTWDSVGLVALQEKRWQEAWDAYDRAARGQKAAGGGSYASALYGRGVAARRLGRTAEGDADIAAATAVDAKIAAAYAGYGQTP